MKSVRLLDYITFNGSSWQVTAQDGALLTLTDLTDGSTRQIPVTDLLTDESYVPDTPDRLPDLETTAVLDTLDAKTREYTEFLHRHIYELVHGVPPTSDDADDQRVSEPDPRFSLELPMEQRIAAKIADLTDHGRPTSRATLYRMLSAYRAQGIAGLVDSRKVRHTTVPGRADPRVVTLLEEEIAGQTNLSTGTRSRAIMRVTHTAEDNGWTVPSRATMYRILRKLERDRSPFGTATTRRSKANRPDRAWGTRHPQRPGELVEIDSTPLDLMVIYPDGSTGRIDITAAVDIATRTVLAVIARPVATKAVDAAVLLAKSMTPLTLQPGWPESLAYSRSILPTGMLPDDAEAAAQVAAKPVIVPESITMDRGRAFKSTTFISACERLQINLTLSAPRTPTDKPHIESFFRGLRTGFVQHLAGYVGPTVVQRGKDPSEQAVWTMAEVQNLMDMWVVGVYQNRSQEGLRIAAMPKRKLTPNEMYAALATVAPQAAVTFERDDYIALLPVVYRSIQPYGVNFDGLHYSAPELAEYRGMSSGLPAPASGKWEVRYDPHRMNRIWVRDHVKGRWIEAQWVMNAQVAAPFSQDVLTAAKRVLSRTDNQLAGKDVAEQINRILTTPTTAKERSASKRSRTAEGSVPEVPETAPEQAVADLDQTPQSPAPRPVSPPRSAAARRVDEDDIF
ncbi:MAG TPA: DDE-type integrase/transposase/recombinase [Candidatus Corynebacterium avicola]|uniref:DDE-type integrase/transposase/recombinase n=1 Tax=Candidatus Corynebacterium avicola TaxID=2838527 RepID=A0A9D1RMV9_9CORY|nr:DDE-type integrase/transposase/recombinase [Candidatus Corynebacterium avicola]